MFWKGVLFSCSFIDASMKWLVLLFVLFLENIYFSKKLAVLTAYKSTFLLKFLQLQCILEFYLVKTGLIHFETSFLHVAVANECTFCKKLFFTAGIGVVKWSTIEKICYRKKSYIFFRWPSNVFAKWIHSV